MRRKGSCKSNDTDDGEGGREVTRDSAATDIPVLAINSSTMASGLRSCSSEEKAAGRPRTSPESAAAFVERRPNVDEEDALDSSAKEVL